MKNLILFMSLIVTAGLFIGCGSSSSGDNNIVQDDATNSKASILGNITPTIQIGSENRDLSDIGDISQILALYLKGGEVDLTMTESVELTAQGDFDVELNSNITDDSTKVLLLMGSDSELIQNKIAGVVPLTGKYENMTSFPVSKIINDIYLGEITKENDKITSSNTLENNTDNFSLDAIVLESMAELDNIEKMALNRYLNTNTTTWIYFSPVIRFIHEQNINLIKNQFSLIEDYGYAGYRIGIYTNKESLFNFNSICDGSKKIEIIPPANVEVLSSGRIISPTNPYINNNLSIIKTDSTMCADLDMGLWAFDRHDQLGEFTLANIKGKEIPSGYWIFKEDDEVRAAFDLSVGSIFDANNNYNVLVPVIKTEVDANNKLTNIIIKWYKYDKVTSSYVEVTDPYIITNHVKEISFFLQDHNGLENNLIYEHIYIDKKYGEISSSYFKNDWYFEGADENTNLVLNGFSLIVDYNEGVALNLDYLRQ